MLVKLVKKNGRGTITKRWECSEAEISEDAGEAILILHLELIVPRKTKQEKLKYGDKVFWLSNKGKILDSYTCYTYKKNGSGPALRS